MKPIDAENVAKNLTAMKERLGVDAISIDTMIDGLLNKEPTIEAEPVRHGHWVKIDLRPRNLFYYCDLCRSNAQAITKHCPNCGAKMDAT